MSQGTERKVADPRPSASILLLSPTNQILLLHRVQTSSSFASAHVFPGGNLTAFHDGAVPALGTGAQHQDSLAYRLGAVRETFEESGILLAREVVDGQDRKMAGMLHLSSDERDRARKSIHANEVRFTDWLDSVGGVPDTGSLIPFTRWITPPNVPKRFTTQMYLYMLPLSANASSEETLASAAIQSASKRGTTATEAIIPTADGGVEHTAAKFDEATAWLQQQERGEIILFPPQCFLLHLLSQFLTGPPSPSSSSLVNAGSTVEYYQEQRIRLLNFLKEMPTAHSPKAAAHPTSQIPWSEKVISPSTLLIRESDRKVVLALDKPGKELKDTGKGGDWERVVLVNFRRGGPSNVEVRGREEVLQEERDFKEKGAKEKL